MTSGTAGVRQSPQSTYEFSEITLARKIILSLLAVAAIAGAYFYCGNQPKSEPEYKFFTVPLEKGTLRAEITSSGTLKPLVEVLVGSQVSGYIKEIYADFESQVKKGQLIALIDPDMFKAKAEQAKADLESAKAAHAKAVVTAADELRTFHRKEQLIANRSISQSEFDAAQTKSDAAEAEVFVEKAKVAQAQGKLAEAELQLQYTNIIAPVDGIVTSRSMDVGQTVTASFQTPVLFKIAEDLTRMQVHTNVDEADIGRVQVNQKATFTVPAFPDQPFEAVVTQIRNDPKVEQNVVTYDVVMDVENKDLRLRPGMTANVVIQLTEIPDALIAPEQALRFTPPEPLMPPLPLTQLKPGQRRLWRLLNATALEPVTVTTGTSAMERVQVLSDQLKPGDQIVVEAISKKKPHAKPSGIRF